MNLKELIRKNIKGDKALWAFIMALALFSFLPVYSASSNLVYTVGSGTISSHILKHSFFLIVGIIIMLTLQHFDYRYFGGFAILGLVPVILLLVLTLLQGSSGEADESNSSRWLQLPGIPLTIQTSTLASITLLIYIARYLTKTRNKKITFNESFLPLIIPMFVIIGLIFPANGSTAAILFAMCLVILFLGGYPTKYLAIFAVSSGMAAALFIFLALNYADKIPSNRVHTWQARIERFVDGSNVEGDQTKYAKAAIVQGKIIGKGPGHGTIKQVLPQSSSDFIYAVIVEEYGLLFGGIGLLTLYLLILYRMVVIATRIHTIFGTLLVFAAGFPIIVQAFINMGVAVNLLPVTGQPLPMVSYGGTAIWITCIAFGIVLSVSAQIKSNDELQKDISKQGINKIEEIA